MTTCFGLFNLMRPSSGQAR